MVEAIEELKQVAGPKFVEVHEIHTFRCYRYKNDNVDESQEVTIQILDMGPDAGLARYSCKAVSDDGCKARGNPGATISEALAVVHWGDLDLPARDGAGKA
ncbi:MAG: hypothetical protein ABJA98_19190 [Acidobacteriota bacterium]